MTGMRSRMKARAGGVLRPAGVMVVVVLAAHACAAPPAVPAQEGVLLRGAVLIDGTGAPGRDADVRLRDERIVEVGALAPQPGERIVDLDGLVLAPGFVDTHSHADGSIFEHRDAVALASQGVTTVVVGNDGSSRLPLADFFARLESEPAAVNVASYAGHGSLRAVVMGGDFRRPATEEEIAAMARLLRAEMEAGALGLSSGLEYDPGIYSEPAEVIALAKVAAGYGGRYISHIRSEDRRFWDAVEEIIDIGREAAMPVQISHTKLAMRAWWGQAGRLLARLDEARDQGVDITADVYPYPYWQSTLTVLFPERDFDDLAEARRVLQEIVPAEGVLVTAFTPEPAYAGRTLQDIAGMRGEEPAAALLSLIDEAERVKANGAGAGEDALEVESMIGTSMAEEDIEAIMRWAHTNFCSDGELAGSHPRGYGSFTRILGRYVRERNVMRLPEAIHKASALAAEHMGLGERGIVRPGYVADLVAFDAETVIDRATTDDPHAVSVGIAGVWVAGVRVWGPDGATGEHPGRVLRRAARR